MKKPVQLTFLGVPKNRLHLSADDAFLEHHHERPEVYRQLVKRSREAKARGFEHYSIKTIWAVMRWHLDLRSDQNEHYKLNDRYYSRYARLIEKQEPDLKGFFHFRKLRT